MRFILSTLAFAASLAFANAQDLQGIPPCALPCFATAVPASGCSLTDTQCQCSTGREKITQAVTECVLGKCSTDEVTALVPAVEAICERAGVTASSFPTAVPTNSGNSSSPSHTATITGTGGPAQSTGGAIANAAAMGAVALGVAAALGF